MKIGVIYESLTVNPFSKSVVKEPVYHFNDKEKIDPYHKDKFGYFFTNDESFGSKYSHWSIKHMVFINLTNPFITNDENLKKVFKKPLTNQFDKFDRPKEDWFEERVNDFIDSNPYERIQVFNYARQMGYDGLILPRDWDGAMGEIISFVVFNENQIKII